MSRDRKHLHQRKTDIMAKAGEKSELNWFVECSLLFCNIRNICAVIQIRGGFRKCSLDTKVIISWCSSLNPLYQLRRVQFYSVLGQIHSRYLQLVFCKVPKLSLALTHFLSLCIDNKCLNFLLNCCRVASLSLSFSDMKKV